MSGAIARGVDRPGAARATTPRRARPIRAADTINGFDPTHDFVKLAGYRTSTASVVANATVANGSSTIVLGDGTKVIFVGVTQLGARSFR